MSRIIRSLWLFAPLFAAIAFLSACKDPNETGLEILPDDDLIHSGFVDTFTVNLKPVLADSVLSMNLSGSMVGNYLDPQMGRINAETFTQFKLTSSNLSFSNNPDNLSLDSIVLSLDLTGFYGRYNDPIPLRIHEIKESFPQKGFLFSNHTLRSDLSFDYAGGYTIDFSNQPGFFDYITIRLDDSLGRRLLFAPADSLKDNSTFLKYFKGLHIRSELADWNSREPGGVFYLDLLDSRTYLELHYHDSLEAKTFKFPVTSDSKRFHSIQRSDYQNRLLNEIIADTNNPYPAYSAIQAGALLSTHVELPGIMSLKGRAINLAELILYVDPSLLGSENRFVPPEVAYLYTSNSAGNAPEDINQVWASSATYNNATHTYTFRLTNTILQSIIDRIPDNGFIIRPARQLDDGRVLNRAIFGAKGNPELAPKFRVAFTTLPE